MSVEELEELCAQVKDKSMQVFIGGEENIIGGFVFTPACVVESGVTGLPYPDDVDGTGPIEREIFVLQPCGQLCAAENDDEDNDDDEDMPLKPEIFN